MAYWSASTQINPQSVVVEIKYPHQTSSLGFVLLIFWGSIVHRETPRSIFVDGHNRCHVSTPVTVVGCRPYCYKLFIEHVFVPFLHQLMCASNQVQRIYMVELDRVSR